MTTRPLPALLLVCASLAGCSSATKWEQDGPPAASRAPVSATPRPAVIHSDGQPPRSARGNPAFYEVFGRRYHVMPTSSGYRERGVASWYGKKFHGKPTSSGAPYNMHAFTAAHKTLPLPTRVRVTNLRNGRSVVVLVNDRGPFVDNRIIDLSYAAASHLDIIRNGTELVEVSAMPYERDVPPPAVMAADEPRGLSLPSPIATAEAAAPQPSEARTTTLFLQVGAFSDPDNAQRFKQRLEDQGVDNVIIHAEQSGANALYRVRLGPIGDVSEYDQLVKRVAALDIRDTHLVSDAGG